MLGALAAFQANPSAHAWDRHVLFMPHALKLLAADVRDLLNRPTQAPCIQEDISTYQRLAPELGLNPNVLVQPTNAEACLKKVPIFIGELLLGQAVDEPDRGMDENLSVSPDQKYMGGTAGPASKGFRHMYFGGLKTDDPIGTFQFPREAIGDAPQRVELMAQKAKAMIRAGQVTWGFRVLAWAIHYLQDLAQPFHVTQVPHPRMVPWLAALAWPPSAAWEALVSGATRNIANYHQAYEGYIANRIEAGEKGSLADCLHRPVELAKLPAKWSSPRELAKAVAEASVPIAKAVGHGALGLFGPKLATPSFDYNELSIRPDLMDSRIEMEKNSCAAIANALTATARLVEWTLKP